MEMTPEQKAFYEYGRARAWLKAHRLKELLVDVPDMGLSFWHMQRNMCGLNALIRDAWQKRAACRVWQVKERYCGNCKYSDYSEWDVPCCECSHANIAEIMDRWEPRKEGES